MKIVEVFWLDTVSSPGWKYKDYRVDERDMIQHSVGYLIENSKKQVVICQSRGRHLENYAERLQIPKCTVKKVRILNAKTRTQA